MIGGLWTRYNWIWDLLDYFFNGNTTHYKSADGTMEIELKFFSQFFEWNRFNRQKVYRKAIKVTINKDYLGGFEITFDTNSLHFLKVFRTFHLLSSRKHSKQKHGQMTATNDYFL